MSNPFSQQYGNVPSSLEPSPAMPPSETNGLGIAGFVVSLIGILTCGVPSIVGLGFSLLALRKKPKGFAIAGVILGVIGLLELVFMVFSVYNVLQTLSDLPASANQTYNRSIAQEHANDVAEEWKLTQQLPSQEEGQKLIEDETDMFGNELRYETDGSSFSIRAAGEDQLFDTEDDIVVGPFSEAQEAIDLWEEGLQFDFDDFDDFEDELEDIEIE